MAKLDSAKHSFDFSKKIFEKISLIKGVGDYNLVVFTSFQVRFLRNLDKEIILLISFIFHGIFGCNLSDATITVKSEA